MKKVLIAGMMLALSGLFGTAYAKDDAKPEKKKRINPAELFGKKDKDGNGQLTLEEFLGKRASNEEAKKKGAVYFKKKDKDGNGTLSKEEMAAKPEGGKKKKKKDATK